MHAIQTASSNRAVVPGGRSPLHVSHLSHLSSVLRKIGPLPPASALLGGCADGLPMLLDLTDCGSILIRSQEHATSSADLIHTILASACALNFPDLIRFYVISPDTSRFADLSGLPHCAGLVSSFDRASTVLTIQLAAVAEQRKSGRDRGPINILAFDDLAAVLNYNEHEFQSYLRWLLTYGAALGVVVIASSAVLAVKYRHVFDAFQRIIIEKNSCFNYASDEGPIQFQTLEGL